MPLNADELCKALFLSKRICLCKLPCIAVRNADVSCLSRFHNTVQTVHNVVDWRVPVPHVINVQVNIVHSEVVKALVDHTLDMLLSADTCLNINRGSRQEFRCHNNFIAPGKIFECSADKLLTRSRLIGDCGIKEIHAKVKPALDDLTRMRLVYRP